MLCVTMMILKGVTGMKRVNSTVPIPPGETLKEVMGNLSMSTKELYDRTGYSEDFINQVLAGSKDIRVEFAEKLESAVGIPSSFWVSLQYIYDKDRGYRTL